MYSHQSLDFSEPRERGELNEYNTLCAPRVNDCNVRAICKTSGNCSMQSFILFFFLAQEFLMQDGKRTKKRDGWDDGNLLFVLYEEYFCAGDREKE